MREELHIVPDIPFLWNLGLVHFLQESISCWHQHKDNVHVQQLLTCSTGQAKQWKKTLVLGRIESNFPGVIWVWLDCEARDTKVWGFIWTRGVPGRNYYSWYCPLLTKQISRTAMCIDKKYCSCSGIHTKNYLCHFLPQIASKQLWVESTGFHFKAFAFNWKTYPADILCTIKRNVFAIGNLWLAAI